MHAMQMGASRARLVEVSVEGFGVAGEAVEEATRGLAVKEAHRQPHHPLQQALMQLPRSPEPPNHLAAVLHSHALVSCKHAHAARVRLSIRGPCSISLIYDEQSAFAPAQTLRHLSLSDCDISPSSCLLYSLRALKQVEAVGGIMIRAANVMFYSACALACCSSIGQSA